MVGVSEWEKVTDRVVCVVVAHRLHLVVVVSAGEAGQTCNNHTLSSLEIRGLGQTKLQQYTLSHEFSHAKPG